MKQTEELVILKQLFSNLSKAKKREFLASIRPAKEDTSLLEESSTTQVFLSSKKFKEGKPEVCPFCGKSHIIKNGKKDGIQHYLCKDCGKTFGNTHNTILKSSKKDLSVWKKYIHCMIEKYPLLRCAKECGIDLNGLFISRISNLSEPKWTDIEKVLGGRVEKDSVFVTDSFRGYQRLSYEMNLNHIRISRNKHKNGVFNIQLLNNYYAQLKGMINIRFKGVATKYLNNYLVYHNLVNFSKGSMEHKEEVMRDFVLITDCISKSHDVSKRQAIPVL